MTTKKRKFVTVRIIGYSYTCERYRLRDRLRWSTLIGKKVREAIEMVSDREGTPPFSLNGQKVRRNSVRRLVAGDVLTIKLKK